MECTNGMFITYLAIFKKIISIIQIIAPILGMISLTIILIKLIMNPEEKKLMKQLKNSIIALILLFFIPLLVKVTVNIASDNSSYSACLEDDEQANLDNYSLFDAKYVEINEDNRKSVIINPQEYEKGDERTVTPSTDGSVPSTSNAVYFLNVGASTDAIIIQDDGKFGVIDTSYTSKGDFIVNQLKKLGATELEFIMISHPHVDHVGGYNKIMDSFSVKSFFTKVDGTIYPSYQGTYKRLINKANSKNTFVCDVKLPTCQSFSLGNINFQLYNTEHTYDTSLSAKNQSRIENANSIAAVATINGKRVYFSGDIGNYFGHNRETITAQQIGDIDVYKVAHHGYVSFNNNQDALNYLMADYAVVTNTPSLSSTAVSRIKKSNPYFKEVYYTTNGTVTMHIDTDGTIHFYQ